MALVEFNATYEVTGPDGTRAVFNDQSDPDYVGVITNLTGFDSPEVVENGENLVQMDGGIHGDFFYGRRPVTLEGTVLNPSSILDRNIKLEKISQATNAMRGDATIEFTPTGFPARYLRVRRQQPLRFADAWQKTFQILMVAADPRFYAVTASTQTVFATTPVGVSGRAYPKTYPFSYGPTTPNGQLIVTNAGTADTWPIITLAGPGTNPSILNLTTGQGLYLNYDIGAGETLVLDTLNRTIMLNGASSRYGALNFNLSQWFPLVPGANDLRIAFSAFTSPAAMTVAWRDAWL